MGFSTNYDERNFDLIPEGSYEVIIKTAEERTLPSGAQKIGFSLVIRSDVNQECQNRYLFLDIWKKSEAKQNQYDRQVSGYNFRQLMHLAKCARIPNGKEYETVQDFCAELIGRCIRVDIFHEDYNGRISEKVKADKYANQSIAETAFPDCRHVFQKPASAENQEFALNPAYGAPSARQAQYSAPPAPAVPSVPSGQEEFAVISDDDVPF